ncbi:MAG: hypothetical protein GYA15_01465 [Leptolinea sp.]|jgi:flagellar biosynthesis protein FlhF|nr:hypothetical protein [Leptolinea sp.]
MISRTFRAETMILALEEVKKELGTDALVVSARQIPGGQPWQVWRKPLVEIVAVRLEPGEDASVVIQTGEKQKSVSTDKKTGMKDLNRKDIALPKKMNVPSALRAGRETEIPAAVRAETVLKKAAGEIEKESLPVAASQPLEDSVEIRGKKIKPKPANDGKLELIQKLGDDEKPQDLRIIQLKPDGKPVLPPLELPVLPWQPPQAEADGIEGAWPVLQKFYDQLVRQGVDINMVKRVCQISADTLGYQTAMDARRLGEHLRRQLEAYVRVQREPAQREHRVICLVGPSGAGKTSFAAKLAVRYQKEMKRSVAWVCADTVRTGGIAEARAFTEAIGIPMQIAYTPGECAAIVDALHGNDLIIVDTPACNPRSEGSLIETGALLTAIPERTTWMVIPATVKENDMLNAAGAYAVFNPRALVISKMDETNSFGTVYNLGLRSQLPFAYFSYGAHRLDDLVPAAASRLVQALFTERFD